MSKIALVVEIEVEKINMEPVVAALMKHAANSERDEPGTLNFDVLRTARSGEVGCVPDEWVSNDDNKIWLYELYQDQAAMDVHMAAPSLTEFRDATAGKLKSVKVVTCVVVD